MVQLSDATLWVISVLRRRVPSVDVWFEAKIESHVLPAYNKATDLLLPSVTMAIEACTRVYTLHEDAFKEVIAFVTTTSFWANTEEARAGLVKIAIAIGYGEPLYDAFLEYGVMVRRSPVKSLVAVVGIGAAVEVMDQIDPVDHIESWQAPPQLSLPQGNGTNETVAAPNAVELDPPLATGWILGISGATAAVATLAATTSAVLKRIKVRVSPFSRRDATGWPKWGWKLSSTPILAPQSLGELRLRSAGDPAWQIVEYAAAEEIEWARRSWLKAQRLELKTLRKKEADALQAQSDGTQVGRLTVVHLVAYWSQATRRAFCNQHLVSSASQHSVTHRKAARRPPSPFLGPASRLSDSVLVHSSAF